MPSYGGGPIYSPQATVTQQINGAAVTDVKITSESEGLRCKMYGADGEVLADFLLPAYVPGVSAGVVGKTWGANVQSANDLIISHTGDSDVHLSEADRAKIDAISLEQKTDVSDSTSSVQSLSTTPTDAVLKSQEAIQLHLGKISYWLNQFKNHVDNSGIHASTAAVDEKATKETVSALDTRVTAAEKSITDMSTTITGIEQGTQDSSCTSTAGNTVSKTWNYVYAKNKCDKGYWTRVSTTYTFTGIKLSKAIRGAGSSGSVYRYCNSDCGWVNWSKWSDTETGDDYWVKYPWAFKEAPTVTVTCRCTSDLKSTFGTKYYEYVKRGVFLDVSIGASIDDKVYPPFIAFSTFNPAPYYVAADYELTITAEGWT